MKGLINVTAGVPGEDGYFIFVDLIELFQIRYIWIVYENEVTVF